MHLKVDYATDDLPAEVADAAYQVVLRQGLKEPFVEVELAIWHKVREAFQERCQRARLPERGTA